MPAYFCSPSRNQIASNLRYETADTGWAKAMKKLEGGRMDEDERLAEVIEDMLMYGKGYFAVSAPETIKDAERLLSALAVFLNRAWRVRVRLERGKP